MNNIITDNSKKRYLPHDINTRKLIIKYSNGKIIKTASYCKHNIVFWLNNMCRLECPKREAHF